MKFVDSTSIEVVSGKVHSRGFKKSSFDPWKTIFVGFADGAGIDGGAVDSGGPKREFLRLLIWHLKKSRLFIGPDNHKFLNMDAQGISKLLCFLHFIFQNNSRLEADESRISWSTSVLFCSCCTCTTQCLPTLQSP